MKKWIEKTAFEKALDIISAIALCVWFIFERIQDAGTMACAEIVSCIAICIVCVCQMISFWNVRRAFSYVAIAGIVLLVTVMVLKFIVLA